MAKKFCAIISQSSEWVWTEFGKPLRLVVLMNLILILSRPMNIQAREPNIYGPISFKLVMPIDTSKLYILMPV